MSSLIVQTSSTTVAGRSIDPRAAARLLSSAYARARIADVILAAAEDALDPGRSDPRPWAGEPAFEADLLRAVDEIAAAADSLLAERLTELIATAPPLVVRRLAAVRPWPEHA